MMFNQYPYINVNDLNLDYILNQIRVMMNEVTNFVSINAIKYADPIQWDITRQYEKNTVVIDPVTGTAYISVAPVPAGVALTRPEYWTVVFDLGSFVTKAAKNFTSRYEESTTLTATFPSNTGDWLVWGDILYKALTNITAGDAYVENGNIEHFTIEDIYISYLNTIANILAIVGDLADLTTSDTTSIVNAINSVVTDYMAADNAIDAKIGDLANLTTTDKTSVVNAINEVKSDVVNSSVNLKYLLAGEYNHEALPTIFAQYVVDYESASNFRPYNQGACADENNYYIMFVDDTETHSYAYIIDKASGTRTKYALSVATHANDCTIVGNYLISVFGNDLYVFNKNNMQLLYSQTLVESLLGLTTYDGDKLIGVSSDKHNLYIYDASDVSNITLIENVELATDLVGVAPSGTCLAEDDVLLVTMWDNTKASSIIFAYELNGNLITTITLPKNDLETESLIYENGKVLIFYLRHWDLLRTTGTIKAIDLYNLITSQSDVDLQTSYAVGIYNIYADDSYTGFYVDGTSAKPFIDIFALTQFLEMINANSKAIHATGSFGYATFNHTSDNIELYGGSYLRVTAYCKSLQCINATFRGDIYGDSGIFARYCHLILNGGDYYGVNTKPCINVAYGSLVISNPITCHTGYYGIQASFIPIMANASITNDNLVSTPLYITCVQMVSTANIDYTRGNAANHVVYGTRNIELQGAASQSVPANSYVDVSVTYTVPYPNTSRVWLQIADSSGHDVSIVLMISTANGFTARIYNHDSATATTYFNWIAKGA